MILKLLNDEIDSDAEWLGLTPQNDSEKLQLGRLFQLHEQGSILAPMKVNSDDGTVAIALHPPGPKIEVTP